MTTIVCSVCSTLLMIRHTGVIHALPEFELTSEFELCSMTVKVVLHVLCSSTRLGS